MRGVNIKKVILLFVFLILIFPKIVYAYSNVEYYDFAYIMKYKEYDVSYDKELSAFIFDSDYMFIEKYYFYSFSSSEYSSNQMKDLIERLGTGPDVKTNYVDGNKYSYFNAEWMEGDNKRYEYCFEFSNNIVCGVGDYTYKDKIKKNVGDLFSDDASRVYSLDKVHDKIKNMDVRDVHDVLNKIGVLGDTEEVSINDKVSKKEKNSGVIYLEIIIVSICVLFGIIGVFLLKREKKTS